VTEDPFAHLHDEGYDRPYREPRATWRDAVHTGGRETIGLDGNWHVTPDLFDEGLRQRWFADDDTPISQWARPRDAEPFEAETIELPCCWTSLRQEWRYFEGAMWFARRFDWDGRSPRLVLRLGAAAYEARVFLNGRFLGSHRGASTPAFFEITDAVRVGGNALLIQVDNRRRADRVPMHHFDWFNHGGLYREIALLPLPAVFIRSLQLSLEEGGVRVALTLSDPASGDAKVRIPGLGEAAIPVVDGAGETVLPGSPALWSPHAPNLHHVHARFGRDDIADRVGFRRIEVRGEDILLNGAPFYLKGICVHEEDPERGRVSTEADARRMLEDAKALGCNMLRLAHYPHHERVAQLADELGLMLWEEIPVYWAIDFANPDTYADAENQLLELIARDRNRASVILWGVGNENADTDARYRFMSSLARAARAADGTRPIAAACLINRAHFRIEDRLIADLDVVGLNEYFGWYEPDFGGLRRLLANSRPGKPVVISETGADGVPGLHGGERQLFTEKCQAAIYREQVAIVSEAPYVRGFIPWLLYDYRTERRQTRHQQGWSRKGLIAADKRTRKLAFAVLKTFYDSLPAPDRTGMGGERAGAGGPCV
jgi:beta-glucuronidase